MTQRSRGRRQGVVFSMRIAPSDRERLEQACSADSGPKRLGPWLVWRALAGVGITAAPGSGAALPELLASSGITSPGPALPARAGIAPPAEDMGALPSRGDRVVLDLCAGSGSWSEPYRAAGYAVRRVTLPGCDVRTFVPPADVWGVLCAPPCEEFSLAKNGQPRDFAKGLEIVSACLRVVMTTRPRWWALENPVGLLSRWLGRPAFVFQPCEFGDPWTKRTALWGSFSAPQRGPFVRAIDGGGPICEVCNPDAPGVCSVASHRAVTPPGFARAFFEANQ